MKRLYHVIIAQAFLCFGSCYFDPPCLTPFVTDCPPEAIPMGEEFAIFEQSPEVDLSSCNVCEITWTSDPADAEIHIDGNPPSRVIVVPLRTGVIDVTVSSKCPGYEEALLICSLVAVESEAE